MKGTSQRRGIEGHEPGGRGHPFSQRREHGFHLLQALRLAERVAREHGNIHQSLNFGAEAVLRLLVRCDALRRPERFLLALQACECDARGRLGKEDEAYAQGPRLAALLKAAQSVDSAAVSAQALQDGLKGPAVGARIDAARLASIAAAL